MTRDGLKRYDQSASGIITLDWRRLPIRPRVAAENGREKVDDFRILAIIGVRSKTAGVVQLVERLLAKEKVVGSSPIARSIPPLQKGIFSLSQQTTELVG